MNTPPPSLPSRGLWRAPEASGYRRRMRAFVRFRAPDGSEEELGPGDMIGRSAAASLSIDDVRVSEAHALVSFRGDQLRLLALRGRFAADGQRTTDVALRAGLRIHLGPELAVEVLEVALPEYVLGLEGDRLPPMVLPGTCSLSLAPQPTLQPRYDGDADAVFWSTGESWRMQLRGEPAQPLHSGLRFRIQDQEFRAVDLPLTSAAPTALGGDHRVPLRLVAQHSTVHLRQGQRSLSIGGNAALVLSNLAVSQAPFPWEQLAREVWPGDDDSMALRRRLDTLLSRLRRKLRDARIRSDLVRADGSGNFALLLEADDEVVDET